ncbi:Erythronolide synthase, modules 1 and 2 [Labrenzia sp. THAF82]|uniref:type I polyketide synthase n=1 Tax=Labrenzia sp. THAF82 TaxID=2587861 RepID=UPI00126882FA|nr:type I polyketide synthase [Labrenzia sp. THAF82]QFT32221.1 Erythronolide synthase, modules 1 and 2 [Labrenzia sp. THAF82]
MKHISLDAGNSPVSVVGAACRLPGGISTPQDYWQFLESGRRLTASPPGPDRFSSSALASPSGAPPANYLSGVDLFDAEYFGISPREAMRMDPQHRLFLELAISALEDAAVPTDSLAGQSVGVFLGLYGSDYAWLPEAASCPPDVHSASGGGPVFAANRLSHFLDLRGPSLAIDTTCSSSLVAVHLAVNALRSKECDLALVGGVNLILSAEVAASSASSIPAAKTGRCETFSKHANGTVMAEGGVVLVLRRSTDNPLPGGREIARIQATAVNHDGQASSLTTPNPDAQKDVIMRAAGQNGIDANKIAYLEAHGTATELGDAFEIEGACHAYKSLRSSEIPVPIGSVKAQLGHLEAAAGAAGLLRACLSLDRGKVTAHPLEGEANDLFSRQTTVIPATEPVRLDRDHLIGVSAFSLGGTNAHIVVGAAPAESKSELSGATNSQCIIFPISGKTANALANQLESHIRFCDSHAHDTVPLESLAGTAAGGRMAHAYRTSVVAETKAQLRAGLNRARQALANGQTPKRVTAADRDVVFVLPGHGAQCAGMAQGLLGKDPVFDRAVTRLDAEFATYCDWSVAKLLASSGNGAKLQDARYAQPALFTVQIAMAECLMARGIELSGLIGYSAGELSAMVLSGMLEEETAVRLCSQRAQRLSTAPPGKMVAVRMPVDDLRRLIAGKTPDIAVAAVNGPETTILSGPAESLTSLAQTLESKGHLCIDTGIAYCFHHPAMTEASRNLEQLFGTTETRWSAPRVPVYSCVTGARLTPDDLTRDYWQRSACATLRFDMAAEAALSDGFKTFLEVSPTAVLTGDLRDCMRLSGRKAVAVATLRRGVPDRRALAIAGSELFNAGALSSVVPFNPEGGQWVDLPSYAWQRASHWWPPLRKDTPEKAANNSAPSISTENRKLYYLDWVETAAPCKVSGDTVRRTNMAAAEEAETQRLSDYDHHADLIEKICGHYSLVTLQKLSQGQTIPEPSFLADRHQFERHERRLLHCLFTIARRSGCLRQDGPNNSPATLDFDLIKALEIVRRDVPAIAPELDMIERTGPFIADVLLGKRQALDLLFPDGTANDVADVFSASGIAKVMNGIAAGVIKGLLRERIGAAPLKVLEIGAGTGGTTAEILPLIEATGGSYTITDISQTLLRFADKRFSDHSSPVFQRLDISASPDTQGFSGAAYDVIICANVLHATPDIAQSLTHVRNLLAPGGLLLLCEAVAANPLVDLTFGLTRDWWNYADIALRKDHPLLSGESWTGVLQTQGFEDIRLLPTEKSLSDTLQNAVICANTPPEQAALLLKRHWLVIGKDGALRHHTAKALTAISPNVTQVTSLETATLNNLRDDLPLGIVDLRFLAPRVQEGAGAQHLVDQFRKAVPGLLKTIQVLAGRPGPAPLLVIPTAGATRPIMSAAPADPLQAGLAGLAETIAAEHQDWDVRCPDIHPATVPSVANVVLRELRSPRQEARTAVTGAKRHGARIRLEPAGTTPKPDLDPEALFVVTGGTGAIGLLTAEWLANRGARRLLLAQRGRGSEAAAQRCRKLQDHGLTVTMESVDFADPDAAARFADDLISRKPAGIVHAAGIFSDRLLMSQDWRGFEAALGAKIVGGWEAYRVLSACPDAFLIFCGSSAGLLNPSGLGNYSAANAFLGSLAAHARAAGLKATSLNWGGWSDLGMATRQSDRWFERWQQLGVKSLAPQDLFETLDLAAAGTAHAETWVMDVDWDLYAEGQPDWRRNLVSNLVARTPASNPKSVSLAGTTQSDTPKTAGPLLEPGASSEDRREKIMEIVRERSLVVLELAEHFDIEPDLPLADLGLDSLLALELRGDLCDIFGLPLQHTLLFDCPTLERLVDHLDTEFQRNRTCP